MFTAHKLNKSPRYTMVTSVNVARYFVWTGWNKTNAVNAMLVLNTVIPAVHTGLRELQFMCCEHVFSIMSEEVIFEVIKSKCLPILLYGSEVCPTNSADRHSLQFSVNKIVYKIFRTMSKDLYSEIYVHFGIDSVENLVANRRNRFINGHGETDNFADSFRLFRCLFNFCLL